MPDYDLIACKLSTVLSIALHFLFLAELRKGETNRRADSCGKFPVNNICFTVFAWHGFKLGLTPTIRSTMLCMDPGTGSFTTKAKDKRPSPSCFIGGQGSRGDVRELTA